MNYYIIKNDRNKLNKISLKNSSNNTSSFQEQHTIINDTFDNNYSYSKNNNKKINFSNNFNNFQNKSEPKGLKEINLNEEIIKGKKNKINNVNKNEQKASKRGIISNKVAMNLSYTGFEDKNEICSCIIY